MKTAGQYFAERVKANGDKPAQEMTKREMIATMLYQGVLANPGATQVTMTKIISLADTFLWDLEKSRA